MPYPLGHGASAGLSQVHCLSSMGKCVSRMARLFLLSPHRAAHLCVSDFQESCAQHPVDIAPMAVQVNVSHRMAMHCSVRTLNWHGPRLFTCEMHDGVSPVHPRQNQ